MNNNDLLRQISDLEHYRKELRMRERAAKTREQSLANSEFQAPMGNIQKAKKSLVENLPAHMVPQNIGSLYGVAWPFWYSVEFDFGEDVTHGPGVTQTNDFTVTQEAAFILLAISRSSEDNSLSGRYGPWGITIRDRQSSRFFNNEPIPFQMIGTRANPMVFPTGFYVSPTAQLDITMESLAGSQFNTTGSGKHEIMLHGVRVRPDADDRILSLIFGNG